MFLRFLACALLCLGGLVGCSGKQQGPVVNTAQGDVQGFIKEQVNLFYGIPYAAPPVGELRWTAPQPHAKWQGVVKATQAPPQEPSSAPPEQEPQQPQKQPPQEPPHD